MQYEFYSIIARHVGKANYLNNQENYQQDYPYASTYNLGLKNHSNFSWKG